MSQGDSSSWSCSASMYRIFVGDSAGSYPSISTRTGTSLPAVPGGISTWILVLPTTAARGASVAPKNTFTRALGSKPSPSTLPRRNPSVVTSVGKSPVIVGAGLGFAAGGASRQLASKHTTIAQRIMRISIAALLATGCGDDPSGFAGDYETLSVERGACGEVGTPEAIPDNAHWFRLADTENDAGALVAYYACFDAETCAEVYDLYRSFGRSADGWLTTVATAIDPGCTLQFRERRLVRIDDATIAIEDVLYRDVDPSLSGDACAIEEARRRGTSMPCVEQVVFVADEH